MRVPREDRRHCNPIASLRGETCRWRRPLHKWRPWPLPPPPCTPQLAQHAGPTGLLYDRCWALVDPDGSALRLKRHPALASIAARVDRKRRLLVVTAAGEEQALEVPLPEGGSADALPCCGRGSLCGSGGGGDECSGGSSGSPCSPSSCALPLASATQAAQPYSVRVCSRTAWVQRSAAATGGDVAAAAWFSRVLGTPCRLVQQAAQPSQTARSGGSAATSAEVEAGAGARADGSSSSGSGDGGGGITTSSGDSSGSGTSSGSSRSFANEGHLLVLGTASLADLASRAGSREPLQVFAQRFRWEAAQLGVCGGGWGGLLRAQTCTHPKLSCAGCSPVSALMHYGPRRNSLACPAGPTWLLRAALRMLRTAGTACTWLPHQKAVSQAAALLGHTWQPPVQPLPTAARCSWPAPALVLAVTWCAYIP